MDRLNEKLRNWSLLTACFVVGGLALQHFTHDAPVSAERTPKPPEVVRHAGGVALEHTQVVSSSDFAPK